MTLTIFSLIFSHYLRADMRGQRVRRRDINLKFPTGGESCRAATDNTVLLLWATKIFFWLADGQKMYKPLLCECVVCFCLYTDIF